jgi:hypothetical protein
MAREQPETRLCRKMKADGIAEYRHRFVIVKHHGSEYARAGVSDFLWCLDGIFGATEVKSPESSQYRRKSVEASVALALDKGPTLKQRVFVRGVIQAGGCGGFAATREQFMEQLACAEQMAAGAVCPGHNLRPFTVLD